MEACRVVARLKVMVSLAVAGMVRCEAMEWFRCMRRLSPQVWGVEVLCRVLNMR